MDTFQQVVERISSERIAQRIIERDATLFNGPAPEISSRLGWVDCPARMADAVTEINEFAASVREEGVESILVLGMGGSSLCAEVVQEINGNPDGYPVISVIDSTDPLSIMNIRDDMDLANTLFIVATKSGGTVETMSLFKYFYGEVARDFGNGQAGNRFIAITDPGSSLESIASEFSFRKTFLNDPEIGGRYSALSYFGMVPAALAGADIGQILAQAVEVRGHANPGLGIFMGAEALAGRNKLTIIADMELDPFGSWAEQLVAESTGKDGRGILPVTKELWLRPEEYSDDRCFVILASSAESKAMVQGQKLANAGRSVMPLQFFSARDLGMQFFQWELGTAIACHIIGVNPFDQPDVESAKASARAALASFTKTGSMPELDYCCELDGIQLAAPDSGGGSFTDLLEGHLAQVKSGGYICLQPFLPNTADTDGQLNALAETIRRRTGVPVVWEYGPRYLHSTGQMHKGGFPAGVFLQLICNGEADLRIPDNPGSSESAISFGSLKKAQAIGDYNAVKATGRPIACCQLDDCYRGLGTLIELVETMGSRPG